MQLVCNIIIILGISGDLARKKVVPSIWNLYRDNLLPADTQIVGFSRSDLDVPALREKVSPHVQLKNEQESSKYDRFWNNHMHYVRGRNPADYVKLDTYIRGLEKNYARCNRMFYYALPPHVYYDVSQQVRNSSMARNGGLTKIVLEKPFGMDLDSSNLLSKQMSTLFKEEQIFRMDHYLGKEMLQNILPLRFGNQMFEPLWNRGAVEAVEILFKESFGTYGRGGYFDKFGIIRDVVQNHLLQAFALVAMEEPLSLSSEDIRNAKVNVLKQTKTLKAKNTVLGQYVANPFAGQYEDGKHGYTDDPTVNKTSKTATYSSTVLYIENERWRGVPFVIRAGKAMDQNQIEIRIYFRARPTVYSVNDHGDDPQNILILRIQPNEAVQMRVRVKKPGIQNDLLETTMDLVYSRKFKV